MSEPTKMTRAEFEAAGGKLDDAPVQMTREQFKAAGGVIPADQPGGALAEHTLNSATFGLSHKLEADYYKARGSPDLYDARTKANPTASTAGDVAGLFTPGPGVVGKIGKEAGALAGLGKGGTRLVRGGTEGGLWGLSNAINEDHIGEPRLTAEHVAAGVLGGALAGMGLETVFGKVGDLGKSALIKAFGGKALSEKLGGLAEETVLKSLDAEKSYGKRNLESRKNEVARFALDNKLVDKLGSMKKSASLADDRAGEAFNEIQKHLGIVDTMGQFDPGAAAARMQGKIAEMNQNPAMAETQSKLQKFVDRFTDTGNPGSPATPAQNALDEVKTFDKATGQWKILQAGRPAAPARAAVPFSEAKAPDTFAKAWETMRDMKKDPDLYRLRGELQDEIFQQADAVAPELGQGLRSANREHANALEFRTLAEARAAKDSIDPIGGVLGAVTHGVSGAVTGTALKLARQRGGFVAASAMDALSQSGALPKIASGFQLLMKSRLADPGFGGPFRAVLETAAAKGADALLQTHLSLAQQDPSYMPTVGMEQEDPRTVAAHTDRAHRLAILANSVDAASQAMDQSVARVLGKQGGRAPTYKSSAPTVEQYEALKRKLEIVVSNSENNQHLADLAPTTSSLAQMATQAGATYLLGKMPKDPTAGLPPALHRPWKPGKAELRDWMRMVDTVADPLSVLDSMRQGIVHREQIETLQTVYPRLYKEFQDKMRDRLSAWEGPLPRRVKSQVSQLLGDLDNPAVTQLIQAAHQRAIPPPAPAPDGRQTIDGDKNEATQAQRMEQK